MLKKFYIKYLIIILASISLLAFAYSANKHMMSDLSDEGKMLYSFIAQEGKRIGKKYKMSPCSVGGGVDHGIWLMSLDFQRFGLPLTEKEARRLIISCLNDYLEAVNNSEELRPFLKAYPFEAKNIDMAVFNYTAEGNDTYHPYIGSISADQGKIRYCTYDESNSFQYQSEKQESYEEALALLDKEKI